MTKRAQNNALVCMVAQQTNDAIKSRSYLQLKHQKTDIQLQSWWCRQLDQCTRGTETLHCQIHHLPHPGSHGLAPAAGVPGTNSKPLSSNIIQKKANCALDKARHGMPCCLMCKLTSCSHAMQLFAVNCRAREYQYQRASYLKNGFFTGPVSVCDQVCHTLEVNIARFVQSLLHHLRHGPGWTQR